MEPNTSKRRQSLVSERYALDTRAKHGLNEMSGSTISRRRNDATARFLGPDVGGIPGEHPQQNKYRHYGDWLKTLLREQQFNGLLDLEMWFGLKQI